MLSLGWLDQTISMGNELEWLLVAFAIFAAACAARLVAQRWTGWRSRDDPGPDGPPGTPEQPLAAAHR